MCLHYLFKAFEQSFWLLFCFSLTDYIYLFANESPVYIKDSRLSSEEAPMQVPEVQTEPHQEDGQ